MANRPRRRRRGTVGPAAKPQSVQPRPASSPGPRMPRLPHNPGTLLGSVPKEAVQDGDDLTTAEREVLEKAGWSAGEPIPDLTDTQLGRRLAAEAETVVAAGRAATDTMLGIDPSTPPIKAPVPRQIEDMPPQERAETAQMFQELEEVRKSLEVSRAQSTTQAPPQVPAGIANVPGMAQAYQTAKVAEDRLAAQQGIGIVDDLGLSGPGKFDPTVAKAPPQPAAPEPVGEEVSSQEQSVAGDAGGAIDDSIVNCPHCGYDLNTDPVAVSRTDKMSYLACILGEKARFMKEYALFGGRIKIRFRTLLPREVDMALLQADHDLKAGKILNQFHYVRVAEIYKLYAGIAEVQRSNQPLLEFQPIDDVAYSGDQLTPMEELKDYFDNEVFLVASLRDAVADQWAKFSQTVRTMEKRATDPDFFAGIE